MTKHAQVELLISLQLCSLIRHDSPQQDRPRARKGAARHECWRASPSISAATTRISSCHSSTGYIHPNLATFLPGTMKPFLASPPAARKKSFCLQGPVGCFLTCTCVPECCPSNSYLGKRNRSGLWIGAPRRSPLGERICLRRHAGIHSRVLHVHPHSVQHRHLERLTLPCRVYRQGIDSDGLHVNLPKS